MSQTSPGAQKAPYAARPLPDTDSEETSDWLDALDAVVEAQGKTRAQYLLDRLADHALMRGIRGPSVRVTPYRNTVSVEEQPPYPGDLDL